MADLPPRRENVFVTGWRPAVGWACASGLWFSAIGAPIIEAMTGKHITVDTGTLITLLTGMLGLGGMRTVEKLNNVSSGH